MQKLNAMQKFKSRALGLNFGAQIDGKPAGTKGAGGQCFFDRFQIPRRVCGAGLCFCLCKRISMESQTPTRTVGFSFRRRATFRGRQWPGAAAEGREGKPTRGEKETERQKEVFDSFQNRSKNFSPKTGKFLIPIKYRNCYFFSVS